MTTRAKVIIDTDPGIDDAIAILMALANPDWDVVGLTTVGGNVSAHQGTRNALALLEYARENAGIADVPLARGSSRPLEGRFANAQHFHGPSGLSHPLPPPRVKPIAGGAVNFLARQLRHWPDGVTVVALGPLTNLARLLRRHPDAAGGIASLVVMGGAVNAPGNATPNAEFNFYCDPLAAAEVMASGIPLTLIDLGASRQAAVGRAEGESVDSEHPQGWLAARLISNWFRQDETRQVFQFYDPLALAAAIRPDVVQTRKFELAVDVHQDPGRCRVTGDGGPGAVAEEVDTGKFFDLLNDLLGLGITGLRRN